LNVDQWRKKERKSKKEETSTKVQLAAPVVAQRQTEKKDVANTDDSPFLFS